MTCGFFEGKVGYAGQKYAVMGVREDGTSTRLGWQNEDEVASGWQSLAAHFRLRDLHLERVAKDGD